MSALTYAYQETSDNRIRKCVRWFQNKFQLRDWTIDLCCGTKPDWVPELFEDCCGATKPEPSRFRARIWINLEVCEENNYHPIQVVVHEMIHDLLSLMDSNLNLVNVDDHSVVNRLEGPITELFFLENNFKVPPIQSFGV